jgi:hypothetical protein
MTAMATHQMKKQIHDVGVPEVPEFLEQIVASGGHLWACRMSADMMHLTENDLYEDVEGIISAGDFIDKTEGAQLLFIRWWGGSFSAERIRVLGPAVSWTVKVAPWPGTNSAWAEPPCAAWLSMASPQTRRTTGVVVPVPGLARLSGPKREATEGVLRGLWSEADGCHDHVQRVHVPPPCRSRPAAAVPGRPRR